MRRGASPHPLRRPHQVARAVLAPTAVFVDLVKERQQAEAAERKADPKVLPHPDA